MKTAIKDIAKTMLTAVPDASFEIRFWDGDGLKIGETPSFVLTFKDKTALSQTLSSGFMGFGEAYMTGSIDLEGDFQSLFRLGFAADYTKHPMPLSLKLRILLVYLLNQNTLTGSRKNIAHHYEVGNPFYKLLLGPTMGYTCGYYHGPDDDVDTAQTNKFEHICRKLQLAEGEHIADLGCGWGGLLIHAAQNHGVTGVGVTLSPSQQSFATDRIKALGLEDKIQVSLLDYRDIEGSYDKVVSVGMMEHVGLRFIPGCFAKIKSILKPGGLGLVHSIGNDRQMPADPWTEKYIFPGAQVPSIGRLVEGVTGQGMNLIDVENLRRHYALTIRGWLNNFEANADPIREMYDEQFVRRYKLYLEVSEASFLWGDNRLFQVLFSNGLTESTPYTRAHLYQDR
jgi:cyclopropane-fatty-acyl-phospholipid synthase